MVSTHPSQSPHRLLVGAVLGISLGLLLSLAPGALPVPRTPPVPAAVTGGGGLARPWL
jgi:hypothetical protein